MTREQMSALLVDVVGEHFETLRGDLLAFVSQHASEIELRVRSEMLEKLLQLRAPSYQGNPKGELYIDGKLVIDFRPMFRELVEDAVARLAPPPSDDP